jgi:hypothetical protein
LRNQEAINLKKKDEIFYYFKINEQKVLNDGVDFVLNIKKLLWNIEKEKLKVYH